ncbi:MAG: class I SAM-dependent methyltransferase [Nitrospinae bacterium]|nr:class I SAM-dependent methyltransferase [Nitrospinota bacterium]MZH41668.1 class I SAM-dependent methyltransferase [Nitrospinota bacterium]
MKCPLCNSSAHFLISGENREYWLCSVCRAIFVPEGFHIPREEEVKRYLQHENSIDNDGYVQMFQNKINILKDYDIQSALDYGCGYEPVLKTLLEKEGIHTTGYDPNFFPDTCLDSFYDLVISTETFEHLRNPAEELERVSSKVKPGGYLAIMTRFYPNEENAFSDWYYKRDPTHIIFYCSQTFEWIAEKTGFKLIFNNEHDFVVLNNSLSREAGSNLVP